MMPGAGLKPIILTKFLALIVDVEIINPKNSIHTTRVIQVSAICFNIFLYSISF